MGRPKRRSVPIEKARRRCDAVCTINPKLDFGEGLTVSAYQAKIKAANDQLSTYNTLVAQTDAASSELKVLESEVSALSRRLLKGVASRFGEDSAEYGKAGGTRQSEAKRPSGKVKVLKAA